ncbi:MAG: hypothetical protein ABEN55_20270 [Bradymonadaceae bacterium]
MEELFIGRRWTGVGVEGLGIAGRIGILDDIGGRRIVGGRAGIAAIGRRLRAGGDAEGGDRDERGESAREELSDRHGRHQFRACVLV